MFCVFTTHMSAHTETVSYARWWIHVLTNFTVIIILQYEHVYQINTLYMLNLHNVLRQLYLS